MSAQSPPLTRRQSDVINILRCRASLGQCWIGPWARKNTKRLYVPTMMSDHHLEPLTVLSDDTIETLTSRGLIRVGPMEDLPRGRRYGFRVSLTDEAAS